MAKAINPKSRAQRAPKESRFYIMVRVREDQRERYEQAAKKAGFERVDGGVALSPWIRRALDKAAAA